MHAANYMLWTQWSREYPRYFNRARVLEVGAGFAEPREPGPDETWTIRPLFTDCEYIGVDWRPGPGVDMVTLAHEMQFDTVFDAVVSASMLEHDPYWQRSLGRMVALLAPHGALFLTWGAAENQSHSEGTAPDGAFHPLPVGRVVRLLSTLNLWIERCHYEDPATGGGVGCVGLVALRRPEDGSGTMRLDVLHAPDLDGLC